MKPQGRIISGLLLSVALCLAFSAPGFARDPYVNIAIKMEKTTFAVGEPVAGRVIIEGHLPATYPGTFKIELYKDGEFVRRAYTYAPIFMGETDYEFKNFGVTGINNGPEDIGQWRIVVSREGTPLSSAEAEFFIEAEDE